MTWSCALRRTSDDEGSLALFLAIIVTAAFVMAGIVVDFGGALTSRERAADIAGQAARAGANALTADSLRDAQANGLLVGAAQARVAAQKVIDLADPGDPGAVTGIVTVSGHTVRVKVQVTQAAHLLGLIGIDSLSQTASASASAIYGDTKQEG